QTETIPVGANPEIVTSDGANIWVTNYGANTVTKLRSSDAAILGVFPTGQSPIGVTFDGSSIWVVNSDENTVTKFATDGTVLGTFSTGGVLPHGIVSD